MAILSAMPSSSRLPSLSRLLEPIRAPFRRNLRLLFLTILAGWGKFLLPLYLSYATGRTLDLVITPFSQGRMGSREALSLGGFYAGTSLAAVLIAGIAAYYRSFFALQMAARIQYLLRERLFGHLQNLSMRFFQSHPSGSLGSRVSSDINAAGNLINQGLVQYSMDGVTSLLLLSFMAHINTFLTGITAALLVPLALCLRYFNPRMRRVSKAMQERQGRITGRAAEVFAGISLVKAYAGERESAQAFNAESDKMLALQFRNAGLQGAMVGVSYTIGQLITWGIFFAGGAALVLRPGTLTPGEVVSFLLYIGFLTGSMQRMVDTLSTVQEGLASLERIGEMLKLSPDPADAPEAVTPPLRGEVEFRGVDFAYRDEPVLRDFSFTFAPGRTYALVGPSGSGKSTLAQLMLRFYDPSGGEIRVDGYPLTKLRMEHFRRHVAVVLQDPVLFSTTIAANIAFARESASPAEIEKAARDAQAHEFISALPEGYGTPLGERGVNLSGGQRQRIAIARALMRDPRILLLDEATSALDPLTERDIKTVIDGLRGTRTVIVIAHRLSTIRDVDEILVLREGRLVESGSHAALLERGGLFARLASEQALTGS